MVAKHPVLEVRLNRFIRPRPTPRQAAFMALPHREALFGGAVGGGKSLALLMSALQYVDLPGYHALIVRKSFPMLAQPGGLIFAAKRLLVPTGVAWNASDSQFVFPSGSTLTFRHFDDVAAEANFQGGEYHFIGVDEATDFTEEQVLFLSSRLRKSPNAPFPLRLRLTAYPHGPGKEWIYRRYVLEGRRHGRPFVESRLEDNPYVDLDSYDEWLRELGHIRYEQFRRGTGPSGTRGPCSSRPGSTIAIWRRPSSQPGCPCAGPGTPRRAMGPVTTQPGCSWGTPQRACGTCSTRGGPGTPRSGWSDSSPPPRSGIRPGPGLASTTRR